MTKMPELLDALDQVTCHVQGAFLDLLVALEAIAHEHVVLADDLRCRAAEVNAMVASSPPR